MAIVVYPPVGYAVVELLSDRNHQRHIVKLGRVADKIVDAHVTDFITCRLADGSACPPADFTGCCDEANGDCVSYRGWWSTRWDAQLIFYDPADLARVAAAEMESWEPQPYAVLDVDEHLYLNPPVWDEINLG